MKRGVITIAITILVTTNAANAQSVSGRVSGTVGEVGSVAGQATAGAGPGGSQSPGSSNLPTGSLVGVGDNGGNFKAGVGLPF